MPESRLFSGGREFPFARKGSHLAVCEVCGDYMYASRAVHYGEGVEIEPGTNVKRAIEETVLCPDCTRTVTRHKQDLERIVLGARAIQKLVDQGAPQWEIDEAVHRWGLEGLA